MLNHVSPAESSDSALIPNFFGVHMVAIPTLDSQGWVSDIATKADYILSCFLATNTSQSTLHRQQNTSMQYLLKKNTNNPQQLELDLQEALLEKLQVSFGETSQAFVDVVVADETIPDQYSIRFTGIVYDGTQQYTVGKLVQFQNSRIIKIAEINNG